MKNIDIYLKIIDANSIIKTIIFICLVCIVIDLIISTISFFKKDNIIVSCKEKTKKKFKFGVIEIIGCFILLPLIIYLIFPILKNTLITTILTIPSFILLFYTIYIKPMVDDKISTFKFDYSLYGSALVILLQSLIKIDLKTSFLKIINESELQIICIIILLFELYTSIYCLILNIYFVIKNLNKIGISTLEKKYNKLVNNLSNLLHYNKITLEFALANKLIKNYSKIKKIILFIPYFSLDIIYCFSKYILSVMFSFILNPILIILKSIISKLTELSETNENQISYGIAKIVSTFSIIIVYMLLQMNEIFQPRIIATYEFIASVILIPIILDGLLSLKSQLKKKSEKT